ncbi:MAG: TonB-dependent receptor [Gammaproteobacteria bacterium]|nr:TonB-dependent receptor [Gammaproteobacteria bacterium]MDH4314277.1 TonB-dependent receptor [Gammaproteobacteria bacterium]MDH5213662.1 TonB-dependent receptor [Gammaproteobacteria bacterium]
MPSLRRVGLNLAIVLLVTPGDAVADSSADRSIDEIQVTATRRARSSSEVPSAITIVAAKDVGKNKLLTDALQSQPGVFLQQTTPGQGAAIVRGLKGSEVLHLVDGLRLNNAIFRNAPTPYLALVPVAAAERIEVLRGAPASLYGSDAVGGVVQVISRFPSFDSTDAGLRREFYMAADTAEKGQTLRGVLEYGTRDKAALLSGEYLQTGDRRTGGGARISPTGYEAWAIRGAMSVTPDERRAWLFDVQLARQPDTPRIDELIAGYGQAEPSSSEYFFRPNQRDFVHIRYSIDDALASADWNIDAGWQRIVDSPVTRDFGASVRNIESNSSELAGMTLSAAHDGEKVSWIAGAEYYRDRIRSQRTEQDVNSGASQQVRPRYPHDSVAQQAAIYINAELNTAERHTFSGGVRYSAFDVKLPAAGTVPEGNASLDDLSADAGWLFDVADNLQFVANAGYGFRAPNVFDLGTLGPRPGNRYNIPNPDLQSEHVTQLDAGLRYLRRNVQAEIVFYQLRYTDRLTSVLTGEVTVDGRDVIQSQNVSTAKIHGVEASAALQLNPRLRADILLNYNYGDQAEPDGSVVPADRMPPLNGHLKFALQASDRWLLEASLLYAARQDRLSPRDIRDVRIDPQGTAGWGTFNTRVEWLPGDGWQLAAELGNLLDKRYRQHGSGIDAAGRNLLLSLARSW